MKLIVWRIAIACNSPLPAHKKKLWIIIIECMGFWFSSKGREAVRLSGLFFTTTKSNFWGTSETRERNSWGISSDHLCSRRSWSQIERCIQRTTRSYPTVTMRSILSHQLLPCQPQRQHILLRKIQSIWSMYKLSWTYLIASCTKDRCFRW